MSVIDFKPFDPRLRTAMTEIQEVMDKYGIGGQVDLISKTHVEFRMFFPKWAPHTKDLKNGRVIWHLRKDNPEGNDLITHFITGMHEQTMRTFLLTEGHVKWLEEHYEIEHTRSPVVRAPENLKGDTQMEQKPSIGRIVHYQKYGTPGGEHKSEPSPAVITQVFEDGETCQLFVMNPNGLYFNKTPYSAEPKGGHWSWPPRV